MNAVKLFTSKIKGIESISSDGTITFSTEELTEQDMEDLSHLRMNVINGVLFDDREHPIKEDFYEVNNNEKTKSRK